MVENRITCFTKSRKTKNYTLFILNISLFITLTLTGNIHAKDNLVINPSFEEVTPGKPAAWDTYIAIVGKGEAKLEINQGHSGNNCVVIANYAANDCRFIQNIAVEENKKYKLSCWIKTENVGMKERGANISIGSQLATSKDIKGTNGQWEYVEMYLITQKNIKDINLTVGLGGYSSCNTGKAYIDDVAMEEVQAIPANAVVTALGGSGGSRSGQSGAQNNRQDASANSGSSNWVLWVIIVVAGLVGLSFLLLKSEKGKEKAAD